MSDFPISVTLKGGKDFDSPWIVLYGNTPDEVEAKLQAVISGDLASKTAEAAAFFRGQHNLAAGGVTAPTQQQTQQAQPAQPPVQNVWNQQPQQNQPSQPAQQGVQGGGNLGNCEVCGEELVLKTGQSAKGQWSKKQCPGWRWNNGSPNNHTSEFLK